MEIIQLEHSHISNERHAGGRITQQSSLRTEQGRCPAREISGSGHASLPQHLAILQQPPHGGDQNWVLTQDLC